MRFKNEFIYNINYFVAKSVGRRVQEKPVF